MSAPHPTDPSAIEQELLASLITALADGTTLATILIAVFGVVHYARLLAGCPRTERECIAAAWSALRRRGSHTRPRRVASGRRGQA